VNIFNKNILGKTPLLIPAINIILASLFFHLLDVNIPLKILIPVFLLLAGILLYLKKSQLTFLVLLSFLFFYIRIQLHENEAVDLQLYHELDHKIIQVDGVVVEIPSLDWNKSFKEKRSVAFLIQVNNTKSQVSSVYQKVFVYENLPSKILPGDQVTIIGEFRLPKKRSIPGGFDTYSYYQQKRWVGNLRVKGWDAIEINSSHWHWRRWLYQLRKAFYQQIIKKFPNTSSGFVASVVIGYKNNLNKSQMSQFQNLGIAHVFAISGLHLGLIALWTWWFGGHIFVSVRKRTVATLLMTFLYCMISGASLSSIRAFIMLSCFLGGYLIKKKTNVWNNFFLSMILIFLWNPSVVLSVGFQLSYLAVLSILISHHVLTHNKEFDAFDILQAKDNFKNLKKKIFELLFYSLMISITTGLITAYHFNIISYGSIFLNLIIIPYFTLVLGITFIFSIFSFMLPKVIFILPDLFIQLLFKIPDWLNGLVSTYKYIQAPNEYLILLIIIGFLLLNSISGHVKKMVALNVSYYGLILCILFISQEPSKNQLVVLDVGKAQAIHVQSKSGENFLFDCGTISGYDSISPYLKHRGINQLDAVFISHDNADHFNCWSTIFSKFNIKELYAKPSSLKNTRSFNEMLQVMQTECRGNISINLEVEKKLCHFTCLHPQNKKYKNKNDESVVWFADLDWCEVLFPGDIQKIGVAEILLYRLPIKKKKRILIVPHHGRNVSYLNQLIKWFDPDIIFVSGDKMSKDVELELSKTSIPTILTGNSGTIMVDDTTNFSEMRHNSLFHKSAH